MEIVKFENNPILTIEDLPFKANSVFNPGAVKFDNEYLLLCRVELPVGRSSFVLARSKDGRKFKVDAKPCLNPGDHGEFNDLTEWGIEDPRITRIENKYLITYTRSEEHTSELQSLRHLVCRLLLEKKNK